MLCGYLAGKVSFQAFFIGSYLPVVGIFSDKISNQPLA
jgi:hypothetical protein